MAKSPSSETQHLPEQIRVSVGSAIVVGLLEGKLDAEPTTAYLMTHKAGRCAANCGFCPQARGSQSKAELLSRVSWPAFSTPRVIGSIANAARAGKIRRVCIQTLNYSEVFRDLCGFIQELKLGTDVPISVSCRSISREKPGNQGLRQGGPSLATQHAMCSETSGQAVRSPPFDEMRAPDGSIRDQYQAFAGWLDRTSPERIAQKRDEAERAFHRVGITFAVYGETSGTERLIPFDIVPRIIPAAE